MPQAPIKRPRKLWSVRVVMPAARGACTVHIYAVFAASEVEAGHDTLAMHPGGHVALVQPMADDGGTLVISRGIQTRYSPAKLASAAAFAKVVAAPKREGLPARAAGLGRLQRQELQLLVHDGYWVKPTEGSRQLARMRIECFDSLCLRGLAWCDAAGIYRATEAGHAAVKLRNFAP